MSVRVAIHGAGGRMGRRVVALGAADPDVDVVAAIESASHRHAGGDAGLLAGIGPTGIALGPAWPEAVDVVIDFSVPEATEELVEQCVKRGLPLVFATTGLDAHQDQRLQTAAEVIPIVKAASMSLAVNLAMKLTDVAGRALAAHPTGADVEIIERHHRYKEDAPSGTALAFGKIVAEAMGQTHHQHGRSGRPGPRPHEEIGYHAVRVGDNPGEHNIVFGLLGETLELRVSATSRDCYAQGALVAAQWLKSRPPGLYNMQDVLGL